MCSLFVCGRVTHTGEMLQQNLYHHLQLQSRVHHLVLRECIHSICLKQEHQVTEDDAHNINGTHGSSHLQCGQVANTENINQLRAAFL